MFIPKFSLRSPIPAELAAHFPGRAVVGELKASEIRKVMSGAGVSSRNRRALWAMLSEVSDEPGLLAEVVAFASL